MENPGDQVAAAYLRFDLLIASNLAVSSRKYFFQDRPGKWSKMTSTDGSRALHGNDEGEIREVKFDRTLRWLNQRLERHIHLAYRSIPVI